MEKRGPGRPRNPKVPEGFLGIAVQARKLAKLAEKDSDKLTALRLLSELQQMSGDTTGPPPPNDEAGLANALDRLLSAAGAQAVQAALHRLWPGPCAMIVLEAPNGVDQPQALEEAQRDSPV